MTKILLVEDDKSLREIYGVRLLAEGYDIVSAGDGEEALAMAIKERPRLILSDVMMPKISGFDMLDILRSTTETKDVKVIIMTALSSEDQRKRGEQLGADKYLVKSQVGIEDVVRAVHETLGDLPGVGTNPVPVSQPTHAYEPVAPTPQPIKFLSYIYTILKF
jgi:DNA-binding response OmpR family regulator